MSPGDDVAGYGPVSRSSDATPPAQNVAAAPTDVLLSMPTISRTDGHRIFLVKHDVGTFLEQDLNLKRLNKIHGYLWMAGRPLNARQLLRQKMMGVNIVLTERWQHIEEVLRAQLSIYNMIKCVG
jgi:hypothetical protein